ncbi:haloacid dehalogenase type II [Mucilaginibacter gossypii]|uniref:haloacid dehalogenase type II n=1 Tax=Mucilaginibacter gossypii TaxID=551996 RepID=UPI000DCE5D78|nr:MULTISPECIES: haloacid dehalogenase type II [Mucilaginibacter]QTE39808.1 haloacid dehalogenase type II [Mucilaginibacter gossypii]RAV54186.1 haloacid dehalogenase type II [Mucilaginibacter rubeus]
MAKKQIISENEFRNVFSRRGFIATIVTGLLATQIPLKAVGSGKGSRSNSVKKAILFDGFVIFNPAPVFALAAELFGSQSTELVALWRTKQFEYSWILTAAKQYKDFWRVTEDALTFAAAKIGLAMTDENKARLMNVYLNLDIWPDVVAGLETLKKMNISLSFLSNFTVDMLKSSLKKNNISQYFDHLLSTDEVRAFKPSPAAYQMGIDTLKLPKDDIVFAAFGAWDACGAKFFGFPTFWVNRGDSTPEELGVSADVVGRELPELIAYMKK